MARQLDSHRIDGSSEASYLSSYGVLLHGRSERERASLLVAIYKIEAAARASRPPSGAEEFARVGRESVHGMTYAEILSRADELTTDRERRLSAIDQKGQEAYESLSDPERVWFTVTRLLFCIRDGGLPSYFYNGYAEHLVDCLRSLDLLGDAEMQALLRRERRRFRDGKPTLLATLTGFLSSSSAQTKESEREQNLANSIEEKLNDYAAKHRLA